MNNSRCWWYITCPEATHVDTVPSSGSVAASSWFDVGTHDSLLEAAEFVRVLHHRQGHLVCAPDEIAFPNKWIGAAELKELAARAGTTQYAQRLLENLRLTKLTLA